MIRVLKNWQEIGEAIRFLRCHRLPGHITPEKHWDLRWLYESAKHVPRQKRGIDLGCSGIFGLRFLEAMGFAGLHGADLKISWRDRRIQYGLMWSRRTLKWPFRLINADITNLSRFPDGFFSFASCISVIEHGVQIDALFSEIARVLEPNGGLFLTTDYWDEPVVVGSSIRPYELPWQPFCPETLDRLLQIAKASGLRPSVEMEIPSCQDKVIYWNGVEYTSLALLFECSS